MDHLVQIILLLGVTVAIMVAFQRLHIPSSLGYLLVGLIRAGIAAREPAESAPEGHPWRSLMLGVAGLAPLVVSRRPSVWMPT